MAMHLASKNLSPSKYIEVLSKCPEKLWDLPAISANFAPNPRVVVFQKFQTGKSYQTVLNLMNISQVPRRLRLTGLESEIFCVQYGSCESNARLAPGMSQTFHVIFQPHKNQDYFHEVSYQSEDEIFSVPMIALGPRPLFQFPDFIDLEKTALKLLKTKPVLIKNVGDAPGSFSFSTENSNFTVTPPEGRLDPGETVQVQLHFLPRKIGQMKTFLQLQYESGDAVVSEVYGESERCKISFFESTVDFGDNYLGLPKSKFLTLKNDSDYLTNFLFLQYENVESEEEIRRKCEIAARAIASLETSEKHCKCVKNQRQRIFSEEMRELKSEKFIYENNIFQIGLTKGEVWPYQTKQIEVSFEANDVGLHSSTAYLEITGREDRIPLNMIGNCLGPLLALSTKCLDFQKVYVGIEYSNEIICRNNGPIPGHLLFRSKNTDSERGMMINVEPEQIYLKSGDIETLKVSMLPLKIGSLREQICFSIQESLQSMEITIKGTCLNPLEYVSAQSVVDFGSTGLGFTNCREMVFRNKSHKSIPFFVSIPSDGCELPVTWKKFEVVREKLELCSNPREFLVNPNRGVVEPEDYTKIKIHFTPNIARIGEKELLINIFENLKISPMIFPMKFTGTTASFKVEPKNIDIRFCFIRCRYERSLKITNDSDVHGVFYLVPQPENEDLRYWISEDQPGHLGPRQSTTLTVNVEMTKIGEKTDSIRLLSLGKNAPEICCSLTCVGEGPIVSVEPKILNLGQIKVLKENISKVILANESPIPITYAAYFDNKHSICTVKPCVGILKGTCAERQERSVDLTIKLTLPDAESYRDKLIIETDDEKNIAVELKAIGIGSSVVFEPEIFPEWDIGPLFSHQDYSLSLLARNSGTKHQTFLLTPSADDKVQEKKRKVAKNFSKSIFEIKPETFDLLPNEEVQLYCKVNWHANEVITERWQLFAIEKDSGNKYPIDVTTIRASFVEPNVIFDKDRLNFQLDFGPNEEILHDTEELIIINKSQSSLTGHFSTTPPVFVRNCESLVSNFKKILHSDQPEIIRIYFSYNESKSEHKSEKYSSTLKIEFEEHSDTYEVPCFIEVNFPQLDFETHDLQFYCQTGLIQNFQIQMTNSSSLASVFSIKWLQETFSYEFFSRSTLENRSLSDDYNLASCSDSTASTSSCNNPDSDATISIDEIQSLIWQAFSKVNEAKKEPKHSEEKLINKIIQVSPKTGKVLPHSIENLLLTVNGFQNFKATVQAICEIQRGLSNVLNITLISDTTQISISNLEVDFGKSLYSTSSVQSLKIMNLCKIPLQWEVKINAKLFKIHNNVEFLKPESENSITIERKPRAPGLFEDHLFLKVADIEPFDIKLFGKTIMPQLYVHEVRDTTFQNYERELGTAAVQMIQLEYDKSNCKSTESLNGLETTEFNDNDWEIITIQDDCPKGYELDLAIERLIVADLINQQLDKLNDEANVDEFFNDMKLVVPGYFINLGHLRVGDTVDHLVSITNHGCENVNFKLKNTKNQSRKLLNVLLITKIGVSEISVRLDLKKEYFRDKKTEINHQFHIQVHQGATIPIQINALVIHPSISISREIVDFGEVLVGECRETSLILKNEYTKFNYALLQNNNKPF